MGGRLAVVLLVFSLMVPSMLAANDPGHDSLYVLRIGDTNVTGSINLTGNITATLVQATSRFFGPNLDLRGDGTSSTAQNYLVATATDLKISSGTSIILNEGTGKPVQVGSASTRANLNVSGQIYQNSVLVCLANGTNCPGGNNTGNVSSVSAGNGISVSNPTGAVTVSTSATTCGASEYTYWDGNSWECRADQAGTGDNASWNQALANTLYYGISNPYGFYNSSTIPSYASSAALTAETNQRVGNDSLLYPTANPYGFYNSSTLPAAGYQTSAAGWTNTSTAIYAADTNDNVGIGTISPGQKLTVAGTGNITGAMYFGNSKCSAGEYLTSDAATGLLSCDTPAGTTYTNGTGLLLNGNQFNLSTAYTDSRYLGLTATAADSSKLAGQSGTYFLNITGFNAANITSGNIAIARFPASGTWSLSGGLTISGSSVALPSSTTINSQNVCLADGTNCPADSGGNVSSSTTSTDNAIVRWDGATGAVIQNSGVTIDDSNNLAVAGTINADATGIAISSDGDLVFTGSGDIINFSSDTTDKVYWYSNTYGTGIESSTLTSWSASTHRWRIGGTSATTGTDRMNLTATGLTVNGAIAGTTITASTQFSGPGTGISGTASGLSIGGNAATATALAANGANCAAGQAPLGINESGDAEGCFSVITSETGDISGVTAGDGLTGGGTSGAVTLNVASHAGTAGSIGTVNIGADAIGVNLGTTSTTAYRGDYGNTAYTHSQDTSDVHGLTFTAEGSGGGLDADLLDGQNSLFFLNITGFNAANVTSGTLAVARGGTGTTTSSGTGSVVLNNSPIITGTGTIIASTIRVGANNVCQSDGTNCPTVAGDNSSWNQTHATTLYVSRSSWTSIDNYPTGCGAGHAVQVIGDTLTCINISAFGTGGWINTSTRVYLFNNATNLSVGYVTSQPVLFVDSTNGKIGIGTAAPYATLQVAGTINSTGNLYENNARVCTASNGLCASGGASTAAGWTNTSTTIYTTDTNDNVAIGATSAGQKLEVTGNAKITGILEVDTINSTGIVNLSALTGATNTAGGAQIILDSGTGHYPGGSAFITGGTSSGTYSYGRGANITVAGWDYYGGSNITLTMGNTNSGNSSIRLNDPSGNVRMLIHKEGNVGIGDITPTNKLDVAGAIGISDTTIIDASRNIVNAGTGAFSGALSAATIDTGSGAKEIGDTVGNCASTDVHKGDGGCEAESSLSVASATTATSASDLSCTDCIGATEISDVYLLNTGDAATGDYTFDTSTLAIDSTNNRVGIGDASPSTTLEVSGNTRLTNAVDASPLQFYHTAAGADSKFWDVTQRSTSLEFRTVNDAYSAANNWMEVARSGYTISSVSFPNGNVIFGNDLTITAADSTSSPGTPWVRSNGNYLVINPNTGSNLYLSWDTGAVTYIASQTRIGNGGSPGYATGAGELYVQNDLEYDGNLYGPGADLAELINSSESLEAGDVVVADASASETVKRSTQRYSTAVIGVVSSDPGIILSKSEGDVPLALSGRVPIKVSAENGPIRPGDLLTTSSTPGHAMRCESAQACQGAIVAKSLGFLESGTGTLTGLVMLG